MRDTPNRSNCVVIDFMGPYKVKCHKGPCTNKIWLLLLLNPATQFLAVEILENQSSAAIVSALIRHMSRHGAKDIFMSDIGSNFWPLATKYATIPDSEVKGLPPMWKRLLTKDVGVLNSHGGFLWLLFSTDRHESVSRIEKAVHKIKLYLKKSELLNKFLTPNYTSSEMETFYPP